jgi:PAS domain S-box-containing protein
MELPPLYESQEWFRTTLASIGDAVLATDSQGHVTFVNPVAAALTGWPEAEALGRDITEVFRIVNEDTRQVVEHPVTTVLREGTVVGLANHTVLIARDGVERPIDDSGAPIHNAQGLLLGVVLVFRDITERRRAEAMQTRLAAIVESSDDAIISKTLDGMITSWNQGAERIYGYTAAEVVGQPITLLVPPDLPDDLPGILARLRRGERIDQYETQRVTKDGTLLDIALTISPLVDGAGVVMGASTIARDITARKKAEVALQQAYVHLEQRVQERTAALYQEMAERQRLEREARRAEHFALLGRLAAGVSHEIRNPLTTVFLDIDVLEEEWHSPSPDHGTTIAETFADIKTNLARLENLVQDYLSLARVANLQRNVQHLGNAVEAWCLEIQREITAQGVTLAWHGLEELGEVAFHAGSLRRVLLNLIQNAADTMPQGGTVTVTGQRTATHVQLSVRDTGSGIPAEHLDQIFEPLFTTKPTGTGLGLYIVREILAAHGGGVTVESIEGQGTTFTVTLPCAEGALEY